MDNGTLGRAVELAEQYFGVDPMVDPREGARATSIEKIMVMYLTELYLALPNVGKAVNTESPTHTRPRPPRGALSESSMASPASGVGGTVRSESPHADRVHVDMSMLATRGSPGGGGGGGVDSTTPTRELEVDALRRRCYELEHAANALPATLEKLRELQAYTKDLATQYVAVCFCWCACAGNSCASKPRCSPSPRCPLGTNSRWPTSRRRCSSAPTASTHGRWRRARPTPRWKTREGSWLPRRQRRRR